jgi:SNF2 family DNA or RNA helicase
MRTGRTMLVIDESTRIRNFGARRTKNVMELGDHAPVRRIMSGLVAPKSPMDLFWQFYFLDWRILGFTSETAFRGRYAEVERICYLKNTELINKLRPHYRGAKRLDWMTRDELMAQIRAHHIWVNLVEKIVEFKNLDELQAKIAPYSYTVLKKDCLDLPDKSYEQKLVPLTVEQEAVYGELRDEFTARLNTEAHVTVDTVVALMVRLHQVACGHVVDEVGNYHDLPSNKVEAVLELLREHPGKAVIWTAYVPELHKIVAALKREFGEQSTAAFYGGNRNSRAREEALFLVDPDCRFMVSTQAAGGTGNNWTVADLVIYQANNYDLELRFQSEDRTHRFGQTTKVTYVDLVCPRTVDEKILVSLRKKINLFTIITGQDYREWLI